jgi:hypothetical protein
MMFKKFWYAVLGLALLGSGCGGSAGDLPRASGGGASQGAAELELPKPAGKFKPGVSGPLVQRKVY